MVCVSSCICCVIDSDREGERDNKIIENSKRDSQFKLSEVFIEIIFLVINVYFTKNNVDDVIEVIHIKCIIYIQLETHTTWCFANEL